MRVVLEPPDELIRSFLERDRVWNCFALADLDPPFREHARFPTAVRADGSVAAVVLIYDAGPFCSVIPSGDPDGIAAVLSAAGDLPRRPTLALLLHAVAPVETAYVLGGEVQAVRRMRLSRETLLAVEPPVGVVVESLGPSAADEVNGLLEGWLGHGVSAAQMVEGGVRAIRDGDGRLVSVAVAGPPSARAGIAVIGQVYTAPEARGRGFARTVTASLTAGLLDGGYEQVVLNVLADNTSANRAYAAIGFAEALTYRMVEGALISDASDDGA